MKYDEMNVAFEDVQIHRATILPPTGTRDAPPVEIGLLSYVIY